MEDQVSNKVSYIAKQMRGIAKLRRELKDSVVELDKSIGRIDMIERDLASYLNKEPEDLVG